MRHNRHLIVTDALALDARGSESTRRVCSAQKSRERWKRDRRLFADQMDCVAFTLITDELDQLRIDPDLLPHGDGPRFCVSPGIVHSDLYFQIAEVRAAETLGHFRGVGHRAAVDIQPTIIAESGGLNE